MITSETLFIEAWKQGYIRRQDWEMLLSDLKQNKTNQEIANRLNHAIRRGRLKLTD